nr:hypothetical protein REQ54_00846 [Rhizobium sp. Q54]
MKRMVFGSLFGQIGTYISQPGDDLDNPTKSLLLDSRFAHSLNVHYTERLRLNQNNLFNGYIQYFIFDRPFPALGYLPQYHLSLMLWASNVATYPGLSGLRGRNLQNVNVNVGTSSISLEVEIGGDPMDLDLTYVIYRNPR